MDTNNNGQAPATDDQELAQVLAGMNQQVGDQPTTDSGLQFEETGSLPAPDPAATPAEDAAPAAESTETTPEIAIPDLPEPAEVAPLPETVAETPPAADVPASEPAVIEPLPAAALPPVSISPELESLKKDALEQLRPLVDRLDLPAQEKFDTLLLIIRSTDDQSLLAAANEAAKSIEDETKRAEALLDVIKEIDFFSAGAQPQA